MAMDMSANRIKRLRAWIENDFDGSPAAFCRHHGFPESRASYISQLLNGFRTFGEKAARKLERETNRGEGWFDQTEKGEAEAAFKPGPLHFDENGVGKLPPLERRKIEMFIEFVLSSHEKLHPSPKRRNPEFRPTHQEIASAPTPLKEAAIRATKRAMGPQTLRTSKRVIKKSKDRRTG